MSHFPCGAPPPNTAVWTRKPLDISRQRSIRSEASLQYHPHGACSTKTAKLRRKMLLGHNSDDARYHGCRLRIRVPHVAAGECSHTAVPEYHPPKKTLGSLSRHEEAAPNWYHSVLIFFTVAIAEIVVWYVGCWTQRLLARPKCPKKGMRWTQAEALQWAQPKAQGYSETRLRGEGWMASEQPSPKNTAHSCQGQGCG